VLSDERGRAILMESILADPAFMRLLIARIADTPEWRTLATERLQSPGAGIAPAPHGADAAIYACPMHPEVTSNRPGSCSKCGMELVRQKDS
jgi:hypothetical protein